jgi:hypothetical protein
MGCGWIHLAQDKDQWRTPVNVAMNFRVPQNAENFLSGGATVGFSRRSWFHGVSYILIISFKYVLVFHTGLSTDLVRLPRSLIGHFHTLIIL